MKSKTLALLSLLTFPAMTYAGLPSEDFTVDLTRESFRDGQLPAADDLHPNYQWVCGSYTTRAGQMTGGPGITLNQVFFVRENGLINRSFYFPGRIPLASTGHQLESYAVNPDDPTRVLFHYAIRKNHGGLLIEMSVPTQNSSPDVPSIAFSGMRAAQYLYCISYDDAPGAQKVMNRPWGDPYSN